MKRNPEIGDVIKINNKMLVVLEAEDVEDEDRIRGESYYGYVFKTIPFGPILVVNPSLKEWSLKEGSLNAGQHVSLADIEHHSRCYIGKTVETYVVHQKRLGSKVKETTKVRYEVEN